MGRHKKWCVPEVHDDLAENDISAGPGPCVSELAAAGTLSVHFRDSPVGPMARLDAPTAGDVLGQTFVDFCSAGLGLGARLGIFPQR